jgi:LysR family pca operon transcriptional activator
MATRGGSTLLNPGIKFRHLTCFLEVARQGHVGRAAEKLAITQPAVSKSLKELELLVGARLFDRSRKGVRLSPVGETFMHYASTSVVALQQGLESVAEGWLRGETEIRLGALPTVAARLMPEAVRRFKAEHQGFTVRLTSGPNRYLLERLRARDLDLVVGRLAATEAMTGLAFEQLYAEEVAILVRPGHPLLRRRPLALRLIRDFPVLLPTVEDIIRPLVDRLLLAHGVGPLPDRIETVSAAFGRIYAATSDAVWIISRGVAALDIAAGRLVALPVDTTGTAGPVGFTTRADDVPPMLVRRFMRTARAVAKGMATTIPADGS